MSQPVEPGLLTMMKENRIPLILGSAVCAIILVMAAISMAAFPMSIQAGRSLDKVALDESDLPLGSYIVISSPRSPSDISAESLELGWKQGYRIVFLEDSRLVVQQDISIYPKENITKVLGFPIRLAEWQVEELPPPNIGFEARMYTLTKIENGAVAKAYAIEFIKGDTYSALFSEDKTLLLSLAETAGEKIPPFYISPFVILALAFILMYLLGLMTYSVYVNIHGKIKK